MTTTSGDGTSMSYLVTRPWCRTGGTLLLANNPAQQAEPVDVSSLPWHRSGGRVKAEAGSRRDRVKAGPGQGGTGAGEARSGRAGSGRDEGRARPARGGQIRAEPVRRTLPALAATTTTAGR